MDENVETPLTDEVVDVTRESDQVEFENAIIGHAQDLEVRLRRAEGLLSEVSWCDVKGLETSGHNYGWLCKKERFLNEGK